VVAKDDLVGTSIVCGEILEDQKYVIFGLEFEKDNEISFYDQTGHFFNDKENRIGLLYKTDLLFIKIYYHWEYDGQEITSPLENDDIYPVFHIDRKTINFINPEKKEIIKGDNCIVYRNETIGLNLIKMQKKLIDEITKDNKL